MGRCGAAEDDAGGRGRGREEEEGGWIPAIALFRRGFGPDRLGPDAE